MKNKYLLYFLAAALFAIAGVLSIINGSPFRGVIGCMAAISFLLSGIHYKKNPGNKV